MRHITLSLSSVNSLVALPTQELGLIAPRPTYSVLGSDRGEIRTKAFGILLTMDAKQCVQAIQIIASRIANQIHPRQ
ncbi:hypothetical protein LC593_23140 [Nostoc sp. CHAB 5844]|nr:hypothetical protein [Nostoc sp. CHAB 5844]